MARRSRGWTAEVLVRRGTVLSADAVWEQDNVQEATIIYDTNPVILPGPNVFKMWYRGGWAAMAIGYAESADGITWTKHPANPIFGWVMCPYVIKQAGVYYLYGMGAGGLDVYTSADGVTFVLAAASCIPLGAPGAFDDTAIANTCVMIEGGTWYMLYEAIGPIWAIGLATSPNGINWTKYTGNPVIVNYPGAVGGPQGLQRIGDYCYVWAHRSTGGLPTDGYRYRSRNLLQWQAYPNWPTFPRATYDEGATSYLGQVADPAPLEYNGKAYYYYTASEDGSAASGKGHIKLAIADMTFAQLVGTNENDAGYSGEIDYRTKASIPSSSPRYISDQLCGFYGSWNKGAAGALNIDYVDKPPTNAMARLYVALNPAAWEWLGFQFNAPQNINNYIVEFWAKMSLASALNFQVSRAPLANAISWFWPAEYLQWTNVWTVGTCPLAWTKYTIQMNRSWSSKYPNNPQTSEIILSQVKSIVFSNATNLSTLSVAGFNIRRLP